MLQLHIFNKQSNKDYRLAAWDGEVANPSSHNFSINISRKKIKINGLSKELAKSLINFYREEAHVKEYFSDTEIVIEAKLLESAHHIVFYDAALNQTVIDTSLDTSFYPIYFFAFIFNSYITNGYSQDDAYKLFFDYLVGFDVVILNKLISNLLEAKKYDVGSYLKTFISKVINHKMRVHTLDAKSKFLEVQLLRNRTLVGLSPYAIDLIDSTYKDHQEDLFSGDACLDLFNAVRTGFDKDYAALYFSHLKLALDQVNLKLVAQRGSRVAHEQGPLLVNASHVSLSQVQVNKLLSLTADLKRSYESLASFTVNFSNDDLKLNSSSQSLLANEEAKEILFKLEMSLLRLNSLFVDTNESTLAKLKKETKFIFDNSNQLFSYFKENLYQLNLSTSSIKPILKVLMDSQTHIEQTCFEIKSIFLESKKLNSVAMVYIQRLSARSGHILARIIHGSNLYIENDEKSFEHRLRAIPYTFVCPDFSYVADVAVSFFENASISIITDPKTGAPDIKWQNANDLAISMATSLARAIKSSIKLGYNFHYQLETTLFGSLIQKFRSLLEDKISIILSLSEVASSTLNQALETHKDKLDFAINTVLRYYKLENELEHFMQEEKLKGFEAKIEFIKTLRDVQIDIAGLYLVAEDNSIDFQNFQEQIAEIERDSFVSSSQKANKISKLISSSIDAQAAKRFYIDGINYYEFYVYEQCLNTVGALNKIRASSDKESQADFYFDFSVAPSRIDFGKHVVDSVTTAMGRMIGADDKPSLKKAKGYIDLVSESSDSIFQSSSEAGSAKVIENTCRAMQYSKAISFQSIFQSFDIDGYLVRDTVNSRDNAKIGLHVMEHGTMAATGYCITKEPLFIVHALKELNKPYDSETSLNSQESLNVYSEFSSNLIKFGRIINETGILQRVLLMNQAIARANLKQSLNKNYADLKILLNASYKGNVSDERENANQYILALLLGKTEFIKNYSLTNIKSLVDKQIDLHELPAEIRIYDPYVDPDVFMSGRLKDIAINTRQRLATLLGRLKKPIAVEVIQAALETYGSNLEKWTLLNRRLEDEETVFKLQIKSEINSLSADMKYLEIYQNGFYKELDLGFQGIDIVQLNSDHAEIYNLMANLPKLRELMQINNPQSLLVLIDNPQQAKKPFIDYDLALEWIALGGSFASHMLSDQVIKRWEDKVNREIKWAKLYTQYILKSELSSSEQTFLYEYFAELIEFANLEIDILSQKLDSASQTQAYSKTKFRYKKQIEVLSQLQYKNLDTIDIFDWLVLGGRWVLNGEYQVNIDYILNLFKAEVTHDFELFVQAKPYLQFANGQRIIKQSGSTKEDDLLLSDALAMLDIREQESFQTHLEFLAKQSAEIWTEEIKTLKTRYENKQDLLNDFDDACDEHSKTYTEDFRLRYHSYARITALSKIFAKLHLRDSKLCDLLDNLYYAEDEQAVLEVSETFFGNHKDYLGYIEEILRLGKLELDDAKSIIEMFLYCLLTKLTVDIQDENQVINRLAIFFDQYINVHEEDFPPYVFHKLCAGSHFGFGTNYYLDQSKRESMFKLSLDTGLRLYKFIYKLVSNFSILSHTSVLYRDLFIGDYENGLVPLGYQHDIRCIEESFWDCVKAIRNFVRNYHDKHPLPIIIRSATFSSIFNRSRQALNKFSIVAGLASIGKHSWDIPLVLRAAKLRSEKLFTDDKFQYTAVPLFAPYLTSEGCIKQIYTSITVDELDKLECEYLLPFNSYEEKFTVNKYGYAHVLAVLEPEPLYAGSPDLILPKPDITMSAHTHPQYLQGLTKDIHTPEVWSELSMKQMYAKTELTKILDQVKIPALKQLIFSQNAYASIDEVRAYLDLQLNDLKAEHIDSWIIKASKDSGGRNISDEMILPRDLPKACSFIYSLSRVDDVVMQEFVPNHARAFISPDFHNQIVDEFVESGIALRAKTPYPQLYFAMRAFQSISGIKGYLFSVNPSSVTVNAGQGAKLFYGEPSVIMPPYIASKIQKLFDNYGEMLLKYGIPDHARLYASENDIDVVQDERGFSNIFMLNGLFDYIPYIYVDVPINESKETRRFKVHAVENSYGGIDYYYNYFGDKVILASAKNFHDSIEMIQNKMRQIKAQTANGRELNIDIDLAVIELNSGLGQANLLQNAIEAAANNYDSVVDINQFDSWFYDLASVGMMYKNS